MTVSTTGSTSAWAPGSGRVTECSALTWERSRDGSTCWSVASARREACRRCRRQRGAGRGAQADRDGPGLLVVQQQRRHVPWPRHRAFAGHRAHRGLHRVAEVADELDVAADGCVGWPGGGRRVQGPGPLAWELQQRQQLQQPCRGVAHGVQDASHLGHELAWMAPVWGWRTAACNRPASPGGTDPNAEGGRP